jgi:hypothetical protein
MTRVETESLIAGLAWSPPPSGCWLWTGPTNRRGQPIVSVEGDGTLVHRVAYRLWRKRHRLHGELSPNVPLVPTCGNRFCVNPFHLVPLDPTIPDPRGTFNRSKSSCPKGHPYLGSNLLLRSSGRRRCRTCHAEELRRYREQRRAQAKQHRWLMDELFERVSRGEFIAEYRIVRIA